MIFRIVFIMALSFTFSINSIAQEQNSKQEESSFLNERWKNIASPLTTDAKYIVLGGTALIGVLLLNEDQWIDEPAEELTENRIMSRSLSKFSDDYGSLYPNFAYFAGMYAYGKIYKDPVAEKRAWMMFEASAYSGLTAVALKSIVKEKRPDPSKTKDSFPSGHTTSAFAFASLVQAEHGWGWGSLAYTGAILTAYQRQHNNKHYLHDVVGGATIGAAFGYGISWANKGNSDLSVMAFPSSDGFIAQLRWGF